MFSGRRVGTFTAGLVMIAFGSLFILRNFYAELNLDLIFSLWPVILVLLGLEIIVAYIVNNNDKIRYDGAAILLTLTLSFFAMCMAGVEFVIKHNYIYYR
jgi:hypothetical protein